MDSITQDYGITVAEPTNPTRQGYNFAGWYSDSSLITSYTFSTMPATDITLYAKWNPKVIVVTFVYNNGTADEQVAQYAGSTLVEPTYEGYMFAGWYLDSEFTTEYNDPTYTTFNTTLYAKWFNTITFNSNGGTSVETIAQESGTVVTEPDRPTKEGYTFEGQYSDTELTEAYAFTTMPYNNITLYAKWTINNYTVNYYVQTDSYELLNEILLAPGETIIHIELNSSHNTALTSSGRLFTWGYNNSYGQLGDGTTTDKYTPTEISQTYYELLHSDMVIYNENITVYVPTREGYAFSGWYSDFILTTQYGFGFMPAKDITLFAKWIQN